ncbi:DASS family sodium-coupled anion symporter [Tissierella praeacuta]|uniref:SLC13 family permease n=1 Tax=Tissierella praeacuta TaxID=43131 RepID=UPI00333F9A8E
MSDIASPSGKLTNEKSKDIKKMAWFIIIISIYVIGSRITPPKGLSIEGWKAILLMICATVSWVSEFIPIGISSCVLLFLPNLLKIEQTGVVMQNFATPTLFFILSALVIARAFVDSGLGYRISLYITPIFGKKSKMVLLSLMCCTSAISAVLADIPSAIIIGGIAYTLLQKNNCEPGKSVFGKSVMIGIPIAAAVGGIATPAGSGVNILAINLLKSVAGIDISFLQWSVIGLPMAIVLTFISWVVISKIYKPEMEYVSGLDTIEEEKAALGPMSTDEKKFTFLFSITLILWFTQSITGLETAFVSMLTVLVLFLPGVKLMDWNRAQESISWETLLLVGSCNAIAMILSTTGSAKWLSDTFLSGFASAGIFALVSVVTIFGIFIHLLVPISGAVLAMSVPIIVALSGTAGVDPILLILPLAYTASCVFLIPLDPTTMTTYGYGYWKLSEMPKPGFIIALVWIPLLIGLMMAANYIGFI